MIEVKDVYKSFGDNHVLKGISAQFVPGKANLIIGASGSGKTVFIKCMVGLMHVDQGEILYNGQNQKEMSKRERKSLRQDIGMLFQGNALFASMTVAENIMFPLNMFSNDTTAEKQKQVDLCLERVNLEGKGHLFPREVSGGMQKRVGIARAIVLNPKYLFCDEPNSGLDPMTAIVIDQLIHEITKENNITTIVNTHDMNSVMEIGDHIVYMHQGKKAWEGSSSQVLESKSKELNDFVFASKFIREAVERNR